MRQQLDTAYLLNQWAVWLRVRVGIPGYVSPAWALMRDNVQVIRLPEPDIGDYAAMLIDRLVARLYARYPEAATALWNQYRYSMSNRTLGRLMGVSHVKAGELVSVAFAWIDASLCHYAEAA